RITPKDMKFEVLTDLPNESIYEGMIIKYRITPLLNIPMKWETLIKQVDLYKNFTDFQLRGPYKLWHHFHEFIENEKGVLMKDTVDYELPFGFIGNIAHSLLVKKKIEHIFEYRNEVLEELFNTAKA
ncbi:MAG: SRPBCC family protein, partial [Crocinitomicaceae bacterium]